MRFSYWTKLKTGEIETFGVGALIFNIIRDAAIGQETKRNKKGPPDGVSTQENRTSGQFWVERCLDCLCKRAQVAARGK